MTLTKRRLREISKFLGIQIKSGEKFYVVREKGEEDALIEKNPIEIGEGMVVVMEKK